ncbi:MAG: hypothetical protein F6K19_20725 [Cyanothece sp. SIO1E1]|nr:hypothetical protein [Cyanothece sp. SIO1E1]
MREARNIASNKIAVIQGRMLILVLASICWNTAFAQGSIHLNFPTIDSLQQRIDGEQVLSELKWLDLKAFCDTTKGHHAYESRGELFDTYRYVRQGYTANFELTLYKGRVLEYRSHVDRSFRTNYFDRGLWKEYLRSTEELKSSKWMLSEKEMDSHYTTVIQAYITLLGFKTRDEYGWICEYSAAGYPPEKRLAVMDLIRFKRRDLLVKLLDHPNVQTKIYAADALIYLDMIGEIESVQLVKYKGGRKSRKYKLKKAIRNRLTKGEWRKIHAIRDANYEVITCGNMGSYKMYRSTSKELLSDSAIDKIFSNYQQLKGMGFLE